MAAGPEPTVLLLLGGTLAALGAATALGAALRRRRGGEAVANYERRVASSWVLALLIAAAFASGRLGTVLLFAGASALALREFVRLTEAGPSDRPAVLAAFWVLLPLQYLFVFLGRVEAFTALIPVGGLLLLPILSLLGGDTRRFMARAAELHWGLMLAVFCPSHLPALLLLDLPGPEPGRRTLLLAAFLVVVLEASDLGQYAWGRLLGRHRLAPSISPSKTWEGLVLGLATGTLAGGALWRMTPVTRPEALALAGVAAVAGALGGLVLSALKRDRGVKDWGTLLPGHGGVLDRLDALLFAAPVFFHLVRAAWSG